MRERERKIKSYSLHKEPSSAAHPSPGCLLLYVFKIHLFLYILLKIHLFLDFYSSVAREHSKLRGEPRALSLYLCFCLFVNVVVLFSMYRDFHEAKATHSLTAVHLA